MAKKSKTKVFEDFFAQFQLRSYKQGEMIIRADDDPRGIFCLTKGYIRQYVISRAGGELTLYILQPISYFPMVWAFNNTPNVYYYETLTPAEIGRAPRNQVLDFIKDKPDLIFELMSELLRRHEESLARIEHLVFSDAYRRVISMLLYVAKYFGAKNKDGIVVNHRFTHQDISTLVGVARETVSIEMGKLVQRKFITFVGHTMIFSDIVRLEQELRSSKTAPANN
ncbi:MAG: Crp/Fnr family transcriptional regulator [Candidatus Pacebacteria bacterium]|nr:Crp/Fnr family transcriptional regulator [Candidatus Paceibacterota bacterium]PIR60478.1 MAG: hypothetical protein COU67_01745 [Candidatus Pacebacteria bacterium CG10_big_fil_rev_8_21_14_0_10_44_54]